jgi:acyl dehydratase
VLAGYTLARVPDFVGDELGVSDWLAVDQARIQAFADCTGDQQWIHTDVERCRRESPFGTTVAHGFLTLSLIANLVMQVGAVPPDASGAVNAGLGNVRFRAPVRAGSRVRARVKLSSAESKNGGRMLLALAVAMEVENERDAALTADLFVMLMP